MLWNQAWILCTLNQHSNSGGNVAWCHGTKSTRMWKYRSFEMIKRYGSSLISIILWWLWCDNVCLVRWHHKHQILGQIILVPVILLHVSRNCYIWYKLHKTYIFTVPILLKLRMEIVWNCSGMQDSGMMKLNDYMMLFCWQQPLSFVCFHESLQR